MVSRLISFLVRPILDNLDNSLSLGGYSGVAPITELCYSLVAALPLTQDVGVEGAHGRPGAPKTWLVLLAK